jgi:DTW domain-containing protein
MSVPLCVCALVPTIETTTRVIVLMHHREVKMPTNTGRLAHRCLVNSALVLRGVEGAPVDPEALTVREGTALLLHPTDDAIELDEGFVARVPPPYTLIVPDGSWRQASKMGQREASLRGVQRVKLSSGAATRYQLRRETKAHGLATIEAIARALGVLESPDVEAALIAIFDEVVERTLRARGTPRVGAPRDG